MLIEQGGQSAPVFLLHRVFPFLLCQNLLQQQSSEVPASDESLPVYRQRYAWFLSPALALLLLSLLLNEGPADKPVRLALLGSRAAARLRLQLPRALLHRGAFLVCESLGLLPAHGGLLVLTGARTLP